MHRRISSLRFWEINSGKIDSEDKGLNHQRIWREQTAGEKESRSLQGDISIDEWQSLVPLQVLKDFIVLNGKAKSHKNELFGEDWIWKPLVFPKLDHDICDITWWEIVSDDIDNTDVEEETEQSQGHDNKDADATKEDE